MLNNREYRKLKDLGGWVDGEYLRFPTPDAKRNFEAWQVEQSNTLHVPPSISDPNKDLTIDETDL